MVTLSLRPSSSAPHHHHGHPHPSLTPLLASHDALSQLASTPRQDAPPASPSSPMAPNLPAAASVWLNRRATAQSTTVTTGPSLLWLLFLIPLVLAFLAIVAIAVCIARRRRRAKARHSVLRNVSLVHEEAREKAQREASRSTSTSPGALVKRAASNGSSYIGRGVSRMASLRSSRSGHAGHTTGGNTTVAPSSQGHTRFGSSSSEKSKDHFKDLESGGGPGGVGALSSTYILPSAPATAAQRNSRRSDSGDSEKVWRIAEPQESSAAVKFEDTAGALAVPAAVLVSDSEPRPTRPGQGRRKELSVIGESNGNSPELGQHEADEAKKRDASLLTSPAAGSSSTSIARRLSKRRSNSPTSAGLAPPPVPSSQAPATLLSRARSAPNKMRRNGPRRSPSSSKRKGALAISKPRDSLEGTSWAYTSRAEDWRAASASGNLGVGGSPSSPTFGDADAGGPLSRSKSLDHRLVGASSAGNAEQGGILRRPSIGVAGSRFKERFDDDDE